VNRQAFGETPPSEKAQATQPPVVPDWWALYVDGAGARSTRVGENEIRARHYAWLKSKQPYQNFTPQGRFLFNGVSLFGEPALPSGITTASSLGVLWDLCVPVDAGPPALPILMVRNARRAVVEHPLDFASHVDLAEAYSELGGVQESHWSD